MNDEPKNPRVAFWCMGLLAALVAYPASFGPACWISERTEDGRILSLLYGPVIRVAFSYQPSSDVALKYLT